MDSSRKTQAAIEAVSRAAALCRAVQTSLGGADAVAKQDRSPVTVADYGAQAVVSLALAEAGLDDPIAGEEDTAELARPERAPLREKVVREVARILPGTSEHEVLRAIGRGGHAGGGGGRFWVLDPIDGTKGFLRREQYAVALALIERGRVVLGVLGCPNLPLDPARPDGPRGCLFVAVAGSGCRMLALESGQEREIRVDRVRDPGLARLCESVESGHSSHGDSAEIARVLGIGQPPVRMDSQCKYAAVARGDASIYLRLPTRAGYEEKIWDHAAGVIVVAEAGGRVSDLAGGPLDFGCGRTLRRNRGVVVTNGALHDRVLEACRSVLAAS